MSLAGMSFQGLMDSHSSFFGGAGDVYYRTQNFSTQNNEITDIGLIALSSLNQINDLLICPQPSANDVSFRTIADAANAGVKIQEGAKSFTISHSWVKKIQLANQFSRPEQVFDDRSVVGLVYESILYDIASRTKNYLYGEIVSWNIIANGTNNYTTLSQGATNSSLITPDTLVTEEDVDLFTVLAGETISAKQAVYVNAGYAYVANLLGGIEAVGIAVSSASQGQSLRIQTGGEYTDQTWNWTGNGNIFVGLNGILTQDASGLNQGFLQSVGRPVSPTSIIVEVQEATF